MSSKIRLFVIFSTVLFSLSLVSCGKKEPDTQIKVVSPDSVKAVDARIFNGKVKKLLGEKAELMQMGRFKSDSTAEGVVAGEEFSDKNSWGIKFFYFNKVNNDLIKVYETSLLKGALKQSLNNKIKLNNVNYELFYYDSQDYFIGSGGGEIFSYIIDFNLNKVYYAHFFTVPQHPNSLFLSANIDIAEIRDFFQAHFKKDYPDLKLVKKDYNLEDIF